MELGPKNHNGDGLLGPDSRMVVHVDPLGENVMHLCIAFLTLLPVRRSIRRIVIARIFP